MYVTSSPPPPPDRSRPPTRRLRWARQACGLAAAENLFFFFAAALARRGGIAPGGVAHALVAQPLLTNRTESLPPPKIKLSSWEIMEIVKPAHVRVAPGWAGCYFVLWIAWLPERSQAAPRESCNTMPRSSQGCSNPLKDPPPPMRSCSLVVTVKEREIFRGLASRTARGVLGQTRLNFSHAFEVGLVGALAPRFLAQAGYGEDECIVPRSVSKDHLLVQPDRLADRSSHTRTSVSVCTIRARLAYI